MLFVQQLWQPGHVQEGRGDHCMCFANIHWIFLVRGRVTVVEQMQEAENDLRYMCDIFILNDSCSLLLEKWGRFFATWLHTF